MRLVVSLLLAAANWPQFRGPESSGVAADDPRLPDRWSKTENIAWKTEIPGEGHASPIVWNDRVFTVTAVLEQKDRVLVCLDRKTGKVLWHRTVLTSPLERKHRLNSYASSTPATDGKLVYVTFLDQGDMVVTAYEFDGNQKWLVRPGEFRSVHG